MPADNFDKGLLHTATRMLDNAINEGAGYDNFINVLSLLCVLSILNRNQSVPQQASVPAPPINPLQKLIGELSKGEAGGPSPEALMSLLPLLNNPQLKSKLNPGTLAAVMGLLNNMGGSTPSNQSNEKTESKQEKTEKADRAVPKPETDENKNDLPAAAIMTQGIIADHPEAPSTDNEKRSPGRYLNWKSSF